MSSCKHWNISKKGIAFDPQTGDSFQLNESALFILMLIREGYNAEETATQTSKKFGISYESALTDVLEFLVQLENMSSAA